MRRPRFLLFLAGLLLSAAVAPAYQNPLKDTVQPIDNVANPLIVKHADTYYLYAVTNSFQPNLGPDYGYKCWSSRDMVNWTPRGWALLQVDPWAGSPGTWGQYGFWGLDVQYRDGLFYMFYPSAQTPSGLKHISVARSSSPAGPFTEWITPLISSPDEQEFDPFVFTDDNGRTYLYWCTDKSGRNVISAQEMSSDLSAMIGARSEEIVGAPYAAWEKNICEGPVVIKNGGTYYLIYNGDAYDQADYAVGYATSSSPLGPFTKYAGNPILAKNLTLTPPISAVGAGNIVPSPDGRELFFSYEVAQDGLAPTGNKRIHIDRLSFDNGVLRIAGPTTTPQPDPSGSVIGGASILPANRSGASVSPAVDREQDAHAVTLAGSFTPCRRDSFTTGAIQPAGALTGWSTLGASTPGFAKARYDSANTAYIGEVCRDPYRFRISGVVGNATEWVPYSAIGTGSYVRAKFYMYYGGVDNPSDPRQIPNLRVRASSRFAVSSILEILHHQRLDPNNTTLSTELRPSSDPSRPSVYRVDFDPIDVPQMNHVTYVNGQPYPEGVMVAFETYALEPLEQGYIGMTEYVIGTYPAQEIADSLAAPAQVYEPSASDAGSLRLINSSAELAIFNLLPSTYAGDSPAADWSSSAKCTYSEAGTNSANPPPGITLDSTQVPGRRVGAALRDFHPGPDAARYVRVEPGKQYKIRWHVTSTQNSNLNTGIRFRGRSIKFAWSQKYEISGAFAAGTVNNSIAQQALPGIGCMNPDKNGNENGGWYTLLMNTPMSPEIRPEFDEGASIEQRMPNIAAQPGPGDPNPSRRDLRVGVDMIDTYSQHPNNRAEKGNFTVDRIEVRTYPLVSD